MCEARMPEANVAEQRMPEANVFDVSCGLKSKSEEKQKATSNSKFN